MNFLVRIGKCLRFQGNALEAEHYFDSALDEGSKDLDTYLNAITTYLWLFEDLHKEEYLLKAKKRLEEALQEYDDERLHHYIAQVLFYLGKEDEAGDFLDFYSSAYDLLPSDALREMFDMVKDIELSKARLTILRDLYGDRPEEELKALELREAYFRVFEENKFPLKSDADKWCAVLYLFVRGITKKTEEELMKIAEDGRVDLEEMPPFTRALAQRIKDKFKESERINALLSIAKARILALLEGARAARLAGERKEAGVLVLENAIKAGLVKLEGDDVILLHPALKDVFGERVKRGVFISKASSLAGLFDHLSRRAMDRFVKKIRLLYPSNWNEVLKEQLKSIPLPPEEKDRLLFS